METRALHSTRRAIAHQAVPATQNRNQNRQGSCFAIRRFGCPAGIVKKMDLMGLGINLGQAFLLILPKQKYRPGGGVPPLCGNRNHPRRVPQARKKRGSIRAK